VCEARSHARAFGYGELKKRERVKLGNIIGENESTKPAKVVHGAHTPTDSFIEEFGYEIEKNKIDNFELILRAHSDYLSCSNKPHSARMVFRGLV
jgi:hypothetical protein